MRLRNQQHLSQEDPVRIADSVGLLQLPYGNPESVGYSFQGIASSHSVLFGSGRTGRDRRVSPHQKELTGIDSVGIVDIVDLLQFLPGNAEAARNPGQSVTPSDTVLVRSSRAASGCRACGETRGSIDQKQLTGVD